MKLHFSKVFVAILILLVVVFIVSQAYSRESNQQILKEKDLKYSKTTSEPRIQVNQVYLTSIVGRIKEKDNQLYYYLTPSVNLEIIDDNNQFRIRELIIDDVELTNRPKSSKVRVFFPVDAVESDQNLDSYFNIAIDKFNYDFESKPSQELPYSYKVSEGSNISLQSEFDNIGDKFEFLVVVYNIAGFNEDEVLSQHDKIESTKYFQYAAIDKGSVEALLTFTVVVTFTDGATTYYDFEIPINGDKIVNEGFYTADPKLDGTKF